MVGGAFQTSREIFENPIWQDVQKFRIFIFIYGNAVFSPEGVRKGNITVQRGQFLRSYRNLRQDLEYMENRSIKNYSLSVIKRKVDSLVKEGRLEIEETELGTLFTVVNYELYQGFEHYKSKPLGTELERSENRDGTGMERKENNNKKVKKDKKDNKDYMSEIKEFLVRYQSIEEFNKLNKEYWGMIRETRKSKTVAESVIFKTMEKWVKYDPVVVQYSLKTHIDVADKEKDEKYTLGIMRRTSPEEAKDKLDKKVIPFTKKQPADTKSIFDKYKNMEG